jgi:hypothetical protein
LATVAACRNQLSPNLCDPCKKCLSGIEHLLILLQQHVVLHLDNI